MSQSAGQDALPILNTRSILAILFLCMGFSYLSLHFSETEQGIWPILFLILIQLTPILLAVTTGRINFIALVMLNELVSYSLAKLNQLFNIYKVSAIYPEALIAVRELTICSMLILASYYLFRYLLIRHDTTAEFKQLNLPNKMLHYVGLLCATHIYLSTIVPKSTVTLLLVFYLIGLVLLFSSTATQAPRLLMFYRILALASAANTFLKWGTLSLVGSIGSILFILLFLHRKRINIFLIVTLVTAFCVLQPVKGHYRRFLRYSPDLSVVKKVEVLYALIAWKYFDAQVDEDTIERAGIDVVTAKAIEEGYEEEEVDRADNTETLARGFARIGDDSLERVLAWTPEKVPFWNGESYKNVPYMFIPRFLWPDKPEWKFWNEFGRTYGFLSSDDYQTSVGIGYLGEAYMNFGYLGMYACAMFMGLLIVFVEKLSFTFLGGNYMVTFICFVTTVATSHRSMGPILNSIFLTIVALALIRPVLMRLRKQSPA